jgi:SAM-dependent methyltransferase
MAEDNQQEGLAWQITTWNQMANLYATENAPRMAPVADRVIAHAALRNGEHVLDVGTGTGIVAERVAACVGPSGQVVGVDISPEMLAFAQKQLAARGFTNVSLREGGAESIPADNNSFDVVLASLSLMYVVDRATAAREIARVLRPGGRFVGAVWTGPEQCDLVQFQQIAGGFAATPPVPGVGPGALADPSPFLQQLIDAGIDAHVEIETLGFDVDSFALAWDVFAGVTTARLSPERQQEAKEAVLAAMWPDGEGPRHFRNATQFIIGRKVR